MMMSKFEVTNFDNQHIFALQRWATSRDINRCKPYK